MIVLGQYVFKAPPPCKNWGNYQEPGYFKTVRQVEDHWRLDLDQHYNPRHVPAIIYGFNEYWEPWIYIGQPDDIRSSYPTYYRRVER